MQPVASSISTPFTVTELDKQTRHAQIQELINDFQKNQKGDFTVFMNSYLDLLDLLKPEELVQFKDQICTIVYGTLKQGENLENDLFCYLHQQVDYQVVFVLCWLNSLSKKKIVYS